MRDSDVPELRPVVRPRRIQPAVLATAVVAVLVGVAIWKPWRAGDPGAQAVIEVPTPAATSAPVAVGSGPPQPTGGRVGIAASGASARPRPLGVEVSVPVTLGLNWSNGTQDEHAGWGISVAYLPFGQLDDALLMRRSAIVPSVSWLAVDPVHAGAPTGGSGGAVAGVGGQPVVALAVTWPSGVKATGERLTYLGPLPGVSRPRGSAFPRPLSLAESVPVLLHRAAPGSAERDPASGTFVLPPETSARGVVDWLADGWIPGRYEFEVRAASVAYVVRFQLDSGV